MAALDQDVDRLRIRQPADVSDAIEELLAVETPIDRVVLLGGWIVNYPRAASQLLGVVGKDQRAAVALSSTLLATAVADSDAVDEILATAFADLGGAVRDAAADRPGVRKLIGLADDNGYETVPPADPTWLWPVGKPFPAADTVQGVQARLNYLDLGAGPVDGQWTDQTRRAFVRWQVLNGLEATGELDLDSEDHLRLTTPDAP